jgi:ADP-ribose pyrophosphatase
MLQSAPENPCEDTDPIMKHKPWTALRSKVVYEYAPWIRLIAEDVELPDGRIVNDYLRIESPDFAAIVPVNTSNEIGLIRSYKHGVGKVDLQPPAGYLEAGEDPLMTAKRELREETGCESAHWHALGSFTVAGNRGAGQAHLFLATDCKVVSAPDPGDLERQELLWVPIDEVRQRWARGQFHQLAAIAALGLALAHLFGEE